MAQYPIVYDDALQRQVRSSSTALTEPVDQSFDIGVGGVNLVTLTTAFTLTQKLDVYVNGQMIREGTSSTFAWYRGTVLSQQINFNYTIPQNAWVVVRRYS